MICAECLRLKRFFCLLACPAVNERLAVVDEDLSLAELARPLGRDGLPPSR